MEVRILPLQHFIFGLMLLKKAMLLHSFFLFPSPAPRKALFSFEVNSFIANLLLSSQKTPD